MFASLAEISAGLPADKFHPPRFSQSPGLFRTRLVEEVLGRQGADKKVLLLEAQAGQGKTTLVSQFLRHLDAPHAWYRLGPEDHEPKALLAGLTLCLEQALPGFTRPDDLLALDPRHGLNLILAEAGRRLRRDFFLVFDDGQRLPPAAASLPLLAYLLDTAPSRLRLIILSRRPVTLPSKAIRCHSETLRLDNQVLALSEPETAALCEQLLDAPLSATAGKNLHQTCEGWIAGLLLTEPNLAAHGVSHYGRQKVSDHGPRPSDLSGRLFRQDLLAAYFRAEIWPQVTPDFRAVLMELSLIDNLAPALAVAITGRDDTPQRLADLDERNLFVYRRPDAPASFRLHPLFRDFLRQEAERLSPPARIREIRQQAGAYNLAQGHTLDALRYYRQADDFSALAATLAKAGLELVATGRLPELAGLLAAIPSESEAQHPWLGYFSGLGRELTAPRAGQAAFAAVRRAFKLQGEQLGELLAAAELIKYPSARTEPGPPDARLLSEIESLFLARRDELSLYPRIMVGLHLAAGFCFTAADPARAEHYAALALEEAQAHELVNCIARIRMLQGFIALGRDDHRQATAMIEAGHPLLEHPGVDPVGRAGLHGLTLAVLAATAEFGDFIRGGREILADQAVADLLFPAAEAGRQIIAEAAATLAQGRLEAAAAMIQTALADQRLPLPPIPPHDRLVSELRAGQRHLGQGEYRRAGEILARFLRAANRHRLENLQAAGRFHLALLALREGRQSEARAELALALALMRRHGYRHFTGWEPAMLRELLALAVAEGIESDYARHLAADRLQLGISDQGELFPRLRIRLMGELALASEGEEAAAGQARQLGLADFTPAQRQLLALLITAPRQQLRQEQVQLFLWPDSNPIKARAKFDTLLSRLRKTLAAVFGESAVRNWLHLRKGVLCLENFGNDGCRFMELARQGMEEAGQGRWWRAGNAFAAAFRNWDSLMIEELFACEQACDCRLYFERAATVSVLVWGKRLLALGRPEEALEVVGRVWARDPLNQQLAALLYRIHLERRDLRAARQLLAALTEALRREEFSAAEIAATLAEIKS